MQVAATGTGRVDDPSGLLERHAHRILTWDGCHNVRDLGGLPTRDGGETRFGVVLRADDLCRLTDQGKIALNQCGVGTVIDLRGAFEFDAPHPFGPPFAGKPAYVSLPPTGDEDNHLPPLASAAETYVRNIRVRQQRYADIMKAIASAEDGPVVVHCVSGKDRTGIVAMLLLALVGVNDDLIAEDYALSGILLANTHPDMQTPDVPDDPVERARIGIERLSPPDAAFAVLASLKEDYGGIEGYLLGGGMDAAQIQLLKERLTV